MTPDLPFQDIPSFRPLILIPSYNSGTRLRGTVEGALRAGVPVWVVVDGSTDGSDRTLDDLPDNAPDNVLRVIRLEGNGGKGAAILAGTRLALEAGFTHALSLDSDGQHPTDKIPHFLDTARRHPADLIMGDPVFGPDVPRARLKGRRLTIWWTDLETLWCGLGDTLFGMRVYPLEPLRRAFAQTPFARGFDFDPEIAVRMTWAGCRPRQVPAPVRYFRKDEGGVSHFNYLRDNIKLTLLHFRLVPEFLLLRIWKMRQNKSQWNVSA
ncbi:MAG: glycosyltransferase family 2 protein [Opitutales bacterium]|nr:glycosyltransferase family 2 protein [Opitutales bacterium]